VNHNTDRNRNYEFLILNFELWKSFQSKIENFLNSTLNWLKTSPKFEVFSFKLLHIFNLRQQIENFINLKFKIQNSKFLAPRWLGAIGLIVILSSQGAAHAQQLTSGADFLTIDSGARSEGMGGAFTAVANDVNSLTWNPAGVALLQHPEAGYLYMLYLGGLGYNFGGVAVPLPAGENTFGIGAGFINLGVAPFDSTLGLAPAVSAGDNAFMLSLAYRVKDVVSFGVTGKYVTQDIAGYSANAFGGDAGVLVTPGDRWRVGAGIFNVGQPVEFVSASDPLPTTGRLGVAYQILDLPHHSLLMDVDGAYALYSQTGQGAVGAEYWYDKTLALRAGYTGNSAQQYWTAGLGINLNVLQFDYAFTPVATLGDTHRFSLILRLGADGANGLSSPLGFSAKSFDSGVALNWNRAASKDVVGYNLYVRLPGKDSFTRVTAKPINDTTVKLRHLQNGASYTFAVASVSAAGRESSTAQASAVPSAAPLAAPAASAAAAAPVAASAASPAGLQAPTGLKAVLDGTGFQLTWDQAPSGDTAGFNLYLADGSGNPSKKLSANPITDNKVAIHRVADPDRLYRFVLTAVNKAGMESAPSAVLQTRLSDLQRSALAAYLPNVTILAGDAMAKISWKPVSGAVGYNLYSSHDARTFSLLTKAGPLRNQHAILKPLHNGETYYFAVTSVLANGQESDKTIQMVVPTAGLQNPQ
jgi:hypothetical protein